MPVHSIRSDQERVRICAAPGRCIEVLYSTLPGTRPEQEVQLTQGLQNWFDLRVRRTDLPKGDPDRATDPARPDLFWDGKDLVSRSVVVVGVSWNEALLRFDVTLSRAC